jgi:hypothetical protein
MILLTKVDVSNTPTEDPGIRIDGHKLMQVDEYSIITIEGKEQYSLVYIDGPGYMTFQEQAVDIGRMVEAAKENEAL